MTEYEQIKKLTRQLSDLQNELAGIRERLDDIVSGQTEKAYNMDRAHSIFPGFRRTTMKDARATCKHIQIRLNQLITDSLL